MTIIFSGHGVEIHERGGKYFVIYDGGQIASEDYEVEIPVEDVNIAMRDADGAYQVILKHETSKRRVRRDRLV